MEIKNHLLLTLKLNAQAIKFIIYYLMNKTNAMTLLSEHFTENYTFK